MEAHSKETRKLFSSILMAIAQHEKLDIGSLGEGEMTGLCALWWPNNPHRRDEALAMAGGAL